MADRSHLTPTPTVDRRGRFTIVYRNLAARLLPGRAQKRASSLPPAPFPAARSAADELDTAIFGDDLASDLVESGQLTKREADRVLFFLGEHSNGHVLDTLRIHARLRATGALDAASHSRISQAIDGIRDADIDGPPVLRTERDVEGAAAVVAFISRVPSLRERALRSGDSGAVHGLTVHRIANPALAAVIRSRPHDLDRIIAYAEDRDMGQRSPVEPLVEWLNSGTPSALSDGEL